MEQAKRSLAIGLQSYKKLWETVYRWNTLSWYSNSKLLFFFFSYPFYIHILSTESPLISREKHTISSGEYFLFSVACLDNSAGWSSLEFKFRVEFLPYFFCSKILSETYSIWVSRWYETVFFFLHWEYPLSFSQRLLNPFCYKVV